jgi:GNAT superfamily N-acetyltransferase
MNEETTSALRVRWAHGDAWQVQGELRRRFGGAASVLPGARLMASGLPEAQWNNADVHDPDEADPEALARWYAERGAPPWGMRVAAGATWAYGSFLFRKGLMFVEPSSFTPLPRAHDITIAVVSPGELGLVSKLDAAAYGGSPDARRPWWEPLLASSDVTVAVALMADVPMGVGYTVRSNGWAGPVALAAGLGTTPHARRRGIGSALGSWLIARAFEHGAELVHATALSSATTLPRAWGFTETPGLDVYVAEPAAPGSP